MNNEEAYQLALKVYMAGMNGDPMPEVPEGLREICERTWRLARRRAYIK